MVIVHDLLDRAEQTWRKIIRTEFPLFMDTPVKKAKPDPKNERHWMFYTDGKTTHMDVFKPDFILEMYQKVIQMLYQQAYGARLEQSDELVQRLIHDTFTYLYHHELFHPMYCPDSKDDEKQVDLAIYTGIRKAEPGLSKADVLRKVGNVRNAGWDQIIDTVFFFESNNGGSLEKRIRKVLTENPVDLDTITHLPDAVVPIFDIIEFETQKEPFETLFYPLTRALYGLLFTRESSMRGVVFDYFKKRITQQMKGGKPQMSETEFNDVMQKAVKGFVEELTPDQLQFARIDKREFETDVEMFYKKYNTLQGDNAHKKIIANIATLLIDKRSRYDAVKGFMIPLAKYISLKKDILIVQI